MASFVSRLPMKGTSAIMSPVEGLLTCHDTENKIKHEISETWKHQKKAESSETKPEESCHHGHQSISLRLDPGFGIY